MGIRFSENVLQSPRRFERYLAGEEAVEKIRAEAEKPYAPAAAKLHALTVTWVVCTTPFRIYYSLFLQALGALLYYGLNARKEAMYVYVEGKRQAHYMAMVLNNYLLSSYAQILVDTLNTFSHQASEVFTHTPIALANMDKEVASHFHRQYIKNGELIFDGLLSLKGINGQCFGIGEQFAHLYFETKDDFADEEQHLAAVTKQFTDGAGKEAALLQPAQIDFNPLLDLRKRCVAQLDSPTTEKVRAVFERLNPGIYSLGTEGHRMNVIKTDTQTYLFDPNLGLVKDTEENLSKNLAQNSKLKFCRISSTI